MGAMAKGGDVYMLASRRNGTLYIGVTSDLVGRMCEHRNAVHDGFTQQYYVYLLVWFETHSNIVPAIAREKAMKEWRRAWKVRLIEELNPRWEDLAAGMGFKPLSNA